MREGHIERIDETAWSVIERHFTVQLLAERGHHSSAEAFSRRLCRRWSAGFGPFKTNSLTVRAPIKMDLTIGNRQRSVFRGIGAKLVEGHRKSDHRTRRDPEVEDALALAEGTEV